LTLSSQSILALRSAASLPHVLNVTELLEEARLVDHLYACGAPCAVTGGSRALGKDYLCETFSLPSHNSGFVSVAKTQSLMSCASKAMLLGSHFVLVG
jgi:hypothetical protein